MLFRVVVKASPKLKREAAKHVPPEGGKQVHFTAVQVYSGVFLIKSDDSASNCSILTLPGVSSVVSSICFNLLLATRNWCHQGRSFGQNRKTYTIPKAVDELDDEHDDCCQHRSGVSKFPSKLVYRLVHKSQTWSWPHSGRWR